MSIRNWVALLVSMLVAAICLYLPFVSQTTLPFGAKPSDNQHYRVTPSSYGVPLPDGLQSGDVLDAMRMDTRSRFGLTTFAIPPVGTRINLMVERQGSEQPVAVTFVRIPATALNLLDIMLGIALIWLIAALGLLILWRGRRLAAAGVGIWCLAKLCWEIPIALPLSLPAAGWADMCGMALFYSGTLAGLYFLAEDLAWEKVYNRARHWSRIGFILLVIIFLIGFVSNDLVFYLHGHWLFNPSRINARVLAHLLAFAIPIGMLLFRYRHVQAADRARIRWVLLSVAGIVAAYLVNGSLVNYLLSDVWSDILYSIFSALAFIGFTYAVLRHRLVALDVVLNRALVYASAIAVIVAVFGALEKFVEHAAMGENASTWLAFAVPLGLGFLFNRVHKRVEHGVEYLFFRRQFRAEAALSQFARECGFITHPRTLLDRSVEEVMSHAGAPAVAIFEHVGNGYRRLRQRGSRDFPEYLGVDDPACVRLRANLADADLEGVGSALGDEGVAFPAMLRGVLIGLLVCTPRPGEIYTAKERALLLHLAHEVGASLHAMYVSTARSFLAEVAKGTMPAAAQTQAAAQQLMRAAPAV